MLRILDRPGKLCDGITRREAMRIGGLGSLGLSLPQLLQAQQEQFKLPPELINDRTFGRAKNVIYVWLQGGPPQHETFDPKPNAPVEIRGPFNPIQTNVVGTQFCELLPRTARIADKLAVVRSLSTGNNIHSSSGYHVLTGYKYIGPNARQISPTDKPWFGSLVKMMKPSEDVPPLTTAWIPDVMRLNENVTPAGQTAGILGRQWDPDRFSGDPSLPNYQVQGLEASDISPIRLNRRMSLLEQVDRSFAEFHGNKNLAAFDTFQSQAFDLLTTDKVRKAFAIQNEPANIRDSYGPTQWGQCLLLARRLVEVGCRLVHVNWCREPGDSAVDNPMWDTHAQNPDRLEDALCPIFDVGFSALITDLDQRGLLDETLVVAIAEFGRTPKINEKAGRDHWGSVFSFALAGAGVNGGQVYGTSDKNGAYPEKDKVTPGDVTASIYHLLGIPHTSTYKDPERREHRLTEGHPIRELFAGETALPTLTNPGGEIARVPVFNNSLLLDKQFTAEAPLRPVDFGSRPKGWRATPILVDGSKNTFGASLLKRKTQTQLTLGFGSTGKPSNVKIEQGHQALLAQEMRNPRLGNFKFTINATVEATSKEIFETLFLKNFTCKLVIYRYNELTKNPQQRTDFIVQEFTPAFSPLGKPTFKPFEVAKLLDSTKPGSNFPIGKGYGVAVIVEKTSSGTLELAADQTAFLSINAVELEFNSRTINDKVKV